MDAPIDLTLKRKAAKIAATYKLVIEAAATGYLGRTIEMPGVMGHGETIESCVHDTIEATVFAIGATLEAGELPPAATSEGKRDKQVNIRLTADEKFRLDEAARREGFRSISDFIRAASLGRAG